ncbi:LSU ribosomal protein L22P [Rubrobacter xylanophilus DSM 9941]|uniref:Large ribosomal subunit protein uL22 n=1 Tax=Rubrobacter xylanophilus (strain DSM 9941 / JCM 11954 / NBRC 16129 / PRD-1) TaxID=266117 RepID=RL22_RUBXD|nr:50S ribosomal protein L22 [Rubrobacter xylanophilus]Q1AU34.1 RecName: Full=Large ribosomal subunit protein uL22; AltName: Full=50S ribosomal protein L22 [Rubrobacter xylanophilus DSM 9941]ABG05094.1 LSU ribosomal protein L22P [Rubrobacter xylanophilus DSM 9941]
MRAVAKYVRISPRKARLVADQIRGKSYPEAASILRFTNKRAARILGDVLKSAAANAENNHDADPELLFVEEVRVDEGPTIKRYRPRALGRATMIRKRTSHITLRLGAPEGVPVGGAVDTPGDEEEEE